MIENLLLLHDGHLINGIGIRSANVRGELGDNSEDGKEGSQIAGIKNAGYIASIFLFISKDKL
ncbi:hypothetical protein CTM70_18600 [Photobacterium phosphoreum]|uniref:hypothetical protein n=1 Tax=Photobacterium phosphoreum TaxID=659 RepID=UPI000D15BE43|nr:hypothetical protein [Photobacterium phosphoreum]PSW36368.1 hypothetical protein CTM70_18600 [Photobacterium phosphoreum]